MQVTGIELLSLLIEQDWFIPFFSRMVHWLNGNGAWTVPVVAGPYYSGNQRTIPYRENGGKNNHFFNASCHVQDFKKKLLTLYTINAHFIRMIPPDRR
jgi:hypothetical protein